MRARSVITSLAAGILLAAVSFAQDKAADKPKAGAPPKMDEKAAMEAMQKAATPGEAHKKLEPLVGTFEATVKAYMDPSKPAEESKGTSVNGWVLGNRFIEQKYDGTFMGQPFSGIGYTGYDNVTKKYVGTWMDTMSTGVMISKGTMTGKTMKASSSMSDPTTGKVENMTTTFTITDNDHHKMEMWGRGPDGKNMKMMEIDYTRKK